ncbi:hypothetical protein TNCV_3804651 [Trichonephila clavipes]|nr:hypothetical protein TNCV_3804651 [Trichonephila clavipes]
MCYALQMNVTQMCQNSIVTRWCFIKRVVYRSELIGIQRVSQEYGIWDQEGYTEYPAGFEWPPVTNAELYHESRFCVQHNVRHIRVWTKALFAYRHTGIAPSVMISKKLELHLNSASIIVKVGHRLESAWNDLPVSAIQTQFDTIHKRVRVVLAARGGNCVH